VYLSYYSLIYNVSLRSISHVLSLMKMAETSKITGGEITGDEHIVSLVQPYKGNVYS